MAKFFINRPIVAIVIAILMVIVGLAAAAPAGLAGTDANGPLDPWAYALVHRSAAEAQQYGPLDPWAYAAVHKRDFPAASSAVPEMTVMPRLKSDNGLDWGSAGVGAAGAAFGLVILLVGGTILRKRSTLPRPRF